MFSAARVAPESIRATPEKAPSDPRNDRPRWWWPRPWGGIAGTRALRPPCRRSPGGGRPDRRGPTLDGSPRVDPGPARSAPRRDRRPEEAPGPRRGGDPGGPRDHG